MANESGLYVLNIAPQSRQSRGFTRFCAAALYRHADSWYLRFCWKFACEWKTPRSGIKTLDKAIHWLRLHRDMPSSFIAQKMTYRTSNTAVVRSTASCQTLRKIRDLSPARMLFLRNTRGPTIGATPRDRWLHLDEENGRCIRATMQKYVKP